MFFLQKKNGAKTELCSDVEALPRFELGIKVLQTSALPLGYSAVYKKVPVVLIYYMIFKDIP